MHTEKAQVSDELFDTVTEKPEGTPESLESSETEVAENVDNTSKAEIERNKAIRSTKRKIEDGEMSIDDIKHEWLKKAVQSEIKPKEDIAELVSKAVKAEKEAEQYASARARLNEMDLSEEKRATVSREFEELLESGLSKSKALDKAVRIAGIKMEEPSRYASRIPKPSNRKVEAGDVMKEKIDAGEYPTDLPLKDRIAYLEKLRNGQ